jgi:hypothetical protein
MRVRAQLAEPVKKMKDWMEIGKVHDFSRQFAPPSRGTIERAHHFKLCLLAVVTTQ